MRLLSGIRVKIKWVGVCGSDVEVFRGARAPEFLSTPTRRGPQVAGVIDMRLVTFMAGMLHLVVFMSTVLHTLILVSFVLTSSMTFHLVTGVLVCSILMLSISFVMGSACFLFMHMFM